MKSTTSKSKSITVLLRAQRKSNNAIIYHIKNGEDKEYLVTLINGVATGCAQLSGEQCRACQYGHKCYHKQQCELIESARAAHIEECGSVAGFLYRVPAPIIDESNIVESTLVEVPPAHGDIDDLMTYLTHLEASSQDMSVEEKMIADEMSAYERDLQEWSLATLRKAVEQEGLSIRSRSKAPIVAALVAHRKSALMANLPTECLQDAPVAASSRGHHDTCECPTCRPDLASQQNIMKLGGELSGYYQVSENHLPEPFEGSYYCDDEDDEVSISVESFHDTLTCATGYRVDGNRVLANPVNGLFRCGCTGRWLDASEGCEHIKIVVSSPDRMEKRRQEMESVASGDSIPEQKEMAQIALAAESTSKRSQQKNAIEAEWAEKYPVLSGSLSKVRGEFARGNLHSSRAFSLLR